MIATGTPETPNDRGREMTSEVTIPGKTSTPVIAVLGGGQLGRMLALAGIPLGCRFRFLDPSPEATARVLGPLVVGPLGDAACLDKVARGATVVTYEWEGVPAVGARTLTAGVPVRPDPSALEVAQDRLVEKGMFTDLGIETPAHAAVDDRAGLTRAIESVGLPAVLKTRRGGYDGKGQVVLQEPGGVDAAWDALGGVSLVLEARVPFTRELSVLAVRGLDGDTRCWPLVENVHERGILRTSRAPAPGLSTGLQSTGEAIATRVLDELGYVGVLAIELFEHDGRLLANELAPRVHNSGHWTIEGSTTSQFENHLRAVLGWPLGSTAVPGHAGMVNCIGTMPDPGGILAIDGAHLHDYEKAPRSGRKVGHVTVVAPTPEARDARLAAVRALVHNDG
jgi:5-(carboxyamino)imidazole ribonucleotide synthase